MERIPPHSLEAEQAVLAAVLQEQEALASVMERLEPEDFYLESHRVLFSAMREMSENSTPVDLITLSDHLQATGRLEAAGGPAGLAALAGLISTAANVNYWAGIVKNKSLLRRLISEATALIAEAFEEPEEVDEFLDRAENRILEVGAQQTRVSYRPIKEVVQDSIKIIEEYDRRKGFVTGVPTGFADLDKLTSGFQPGELILLAGRPSMGKTALALNMITHAALHADQTVAFFSLEMTAQQLVIRMICSEAKISFDRLRRGEFTKAQWMPLTNAATALSSARILIDDSPSISVLELKAKCRRIKVEQGIHLVVVDYLQLLRGTGSKKSRDSREQEISEISRALKSMAKELNLPVLALSQLNRAPESREGGEPRLSDLRESGALEQDADVVMLIHRPGFYKKREEGQEAEDRLTRLKIEKQRNGPTGVVELVFQKEYTRFEPYEGKYDESYIPPASY